MRGINVEKNKFLEFVELLKFEGTKTKDHGYIQNYYSQEFSNKKEEKMNILEIGVRDGKSLKLWASWFKNSQIYGVDINKIQENLPLTAGGNLITLTYEPQNINFTIDNAYSKNFLDSIKNDYFDYIIEDGSHRLEHQLFCIENYYSKLRKGGKIIIEDIGCKEEDANKNRTVDECCDEIAKLALKKNYKIKIFDFRDNYMYFSVIIELTK